MLRSTDLLIAAVGAALSLVWLGPGVADAPAASPAPERVDRAPAIKGSRTTGPGVLRERALPRTVEVLGLDAAVIILRDEAGREIYRADAAKGLTLVARDADIPVLTVRIDGVAEVPGTPAPLPRPSRGPLLGCDGAVSALADADASRRPAMCLASLSP